MVGLHHNEVLDTLYEKLYRIKEGIDTQPHISIDDFIRIEVYNFADNKGYILDYLDTSSIIYPRDIVGYLQTSPNLTEQSEQMLLNLDSMVTELANNNITIAQFDSYCNSNINLAYNLDSLSEKISIGLTFAVAKHTANYWNQNYDDWFNLMNDIEESTNLVSKSKSNSKSNKLLEISQDGKDVINQDLEGAKQGAFAVLIAGGLSAGPGGAFAGAIGVSMVYAGTKSLKKAVKIAAGAPWWLDWL